MRYLKHLACMATASYLLLICPQVLSGGLDLLIMIYGNLAQLAVKIIPYNSVYYISTIKTLAAMLTTLLFSSPIILLCTHLWRQSAHSYNIGIIWVVWLLQTAVVSYAKPLAIVIQ